MITLKLERNMEYLDLADPVGVDVHSKIFYACIHGDVFQETESKTEGDLMYSFRRKSNSRLEIGKNAPPPDLKFVKIFTRPNFRV